MSPIFYYFLVIGGLFWFWQRAVSHSTFRELSYSEFKNYLHEGAVTNATVSPDVIQGQIHRSAAASEEKTTNAAAGQKLASTNDFNFRTVRVDDPNLVKELEAARVNFSGVRPSGMSTLLLAWILPIGMMALVWFFISRRVRGAGESILSFGKSRARLVAERETGVTFQDVAGCEEAKYELEEVVDFLKHPGHYKSMGAKIPKGVLLVGPPGTGKTLLARAVAGEAKVPFFSISGSDFVEMFVGIGAARVRDLFQQAKARAPCIVFIDELDAMGRQRGVHIGAVNDEREQTLNQLLVEMDGFAPNAGVIILAATNRPDVLDHALLRPGRFDRQVVVDAPDVDGREAILRVHIRGKPLAKEVNLRHIAQTTPGFSGADLANAINEAALLAVRHHRNEITQADLEEAVEKVVAGPERKSRRLKEEEKRRVAYHEVGHALVAAHSEHADPVHKISIIPRGRAALGYTLQLPAGDQFLLTRSELLDRIRGMLGGRAAEETVFQEVSTGAENDLERATAIARQMVCVFGMSEEVGLVRCAQHPNGLFAPQIDGVFQRDCSEHTAEQIDAEVKKILDEAYDTAKRILGTHRGQLDLVAGELLKCETMDAKAFNQLIGRKMKDEKEVTVPIEASPESPGKI
ncbi:MAG TPA: ATP-dependent zinc metalloprotease FtsH [Candidatus Angelobacter sp.]|nr:ATP-dependent zinc metalloprotease FtsH [Candidatus Angelobacter sp.]